MTMLMFGSHGFCCHTRGLILLQRYIAQEKLHAFAETLTDDRERMIWDRRLVAQEPASLSELGDQYGVSKERIRQIEARIKKRLRMFLEDEIGEEIDFEFDVRDED